MANKINPDCPAAIAMALTGLSAGSAFICGSMGMGCGVPRTQSCGSALANGDPSHSKRRAFLYRGFHLEAWGDRVAIILLGAPDTLQTCTRLRACAAFNQPAFMHPKQADTSAKEGNKALPSTKEPEAFQMSYTAAFFQTCCWSGL